MWRDNRKSDDADPLEGNLTKTTSEAIKMPLIQTDFRTKLMDEQKHILIGGVRETVNRKLGAPDPYISIVTASGWWRTCSNRGNRQPHR